MNGIFGNAIWAMRKARFWSQEKLAVLADLSLGTIKGMEASRASDDPNFRGESVDRVAKAFGLRDATEVAQFVVTGKIDRPEHFWRSAEELYARGKRKKKVPDAFPLNALSLPPDLLMRIQRWAKSDQMDVRDWALNELTEAVTRREEQDAERRRAAMPAEGRRGPGKGNR